MSGENVNKLDIYLLTLKRTRNMVTKYVLIWALLDLLYRFREGPVSCHYLYHRLVKKLMPQNRIEAWE
jgi:hypothetical protein